MKPGSNALKRNLGNSRLPEPKIVLHNQAPVSDARSASSYAFWLKYVLPLLAPFYPKRAARVVTKILINKSCQTGLYYDDGRRPMLGSALICDPKFTDRVVAGK